MSNKRSESIPHSRSFISVGCVCVHLCSWMFKLNPIENNCEEKQCTRNLFFAFHFNRFKCSAIKLNYHSYQHSIHKFHTAFMHHSNVTEWSASALLFAWSQREAFIIRHFRCNLYGETFPHSIKKCACHFCDSMGRCVTAV